MTRKPTDRQVEILDYLLNEIKQWKNTNDLSSPTLDGDIGVFMVNVDLDEKDQDYLKYLLGNLLTFIRDKK